jgi:hypothetical protein
MMEEMTKRTQILKKTCLFYVVRSFFALNWQAKEFDKQYIDLVSIAHKMQLYVFILIYFHED